ncbi:D-alanyl-lipoteichoic acid biosynthesis protein DltD [Desulfosporosinus sp. SB140]|uniref:D-alanyl-lipoteichoic acid biosynthesis protein DltD n=1 Tax=Desulfosporosinus paludis TaxID=3115649 RepID=UPI0038910B3D
MIRKRLAPLGVALFLFFLSILAVGPLTQWLVSSYIKPGVIETASESQIPSLFEGTLLQSKALKDPNVVPMYGSSEFGHGGPYNPTKLFADQPTGWTPYLVGHAGSLDLIQALYAGAQNLKDKKIVLSLSAQWFGGNGIPQNTFAANFSALQAYSMIFNPSLTLQTKRDLAKRLIQFDEVKKTYPILDGLLKYYGQTDPGSIIMELVYWPAARIEMSALEIQDALKTIQVIQHLPAKEIAKNSSGTSQRALPTWSEMQQKATADVQKNETNNPFGVVNNFYKQKIKNPQSLKNSATKGHFYPSPEYSDLNLLMNVLKDEGADPIFLIQPVNGLWYDFTGFPKEQRQKYYSQVRDMANHFAFSLADFSTHEYDKYFMDDPSHPSEKGWLEFDETLDKFVHQKS